MKLKNDLGADFFDLQPKWKWKVLGADFGFLGQLIFLKMLRLSQTARSQDSRNAVVGANETGYHLAGVNPGRDFTAEYVDIREKFVVKSHQMGKGSWTCTWDRNRSHFQTRYTLLRQHGSRCLGRKTVVHDHHGLLRNRCQRASFSRYGATSRLFVNKTPKGVPLRLGN